MSRRDPFRLTTRRPLVAGTGLIALDVVLEAGTNQEPWLWTGGTCGNVLTILSYLGWIAAPIARLNGDAASRRVEEDLRRWGVCLDHARTTPGARTPIVVHRISRSRAGIPFHRFSLTCPNCGSWLPTYRPVVTAAAEKVVGKLGKPRVFFMDRVSRGALVLARAWKDQGALIVFEPAGLGEPRMFREALEVAHVLKYSHERVRALRGIANCGRPLLEIETLGAEGLRYRSNIEGARTKGWEKLEAFDMSELRDAAGSGDWCTAGVLHRLAQKGSSGVLKSTRAQVEEALRFGQALAAWNCGYEGARGGMYAVEKATFRQQVESVISQDGVRAPKPEVPAAEVAEAFECLCPACIEAGRLKQR